MDKNDVKEYLDRLVELYREANKTQLLGYKVKSSVSSDGETGILVYEGIEFLAEKMGLELQEEEIDAVHFKYTHYFVYRGIVFRDYSNKKLKWQY